MTFIADKYLEKEERIWTLPILYSKPSWFSFRLFLHHPKWHRYQTMKTARIHSLSQASAPILNCPISSLLFDFVKHLTQGRYRVVVNNQHPRAKITEFKFQLYHFITNWTKSSKLSGSVAVDYKAAAPLDSISCWSWSTPMFTPVNCSAVMIRLQVCLISPRSPVCFPPVTCSVKFFLFCSKNHYGFFQNLLSGSSLPLNIFSTLFLIVFLENCI